MIFLKLYKLLQRLGLNINIFKYYNELINNFYKIESKYLLNNRDFENLIVALSTYLDKNLNKALNIKYITKNQVVNGKKEKVAVGLKKNKHFDLTKEFFKFLNIEIINLDLEKMIDKLNYVNLMDIKQEYRVIYFSFLLQDKHFLMRDLIEKYKQKEYNEVCKKQINDYREDISKSKKLDYLLDTYIIFSDLKLSENKELSSYCTEHFDNCLKDFINSKQEN